MVALSVTHNHQKDAEMWSRPYVHLTFQCGPSSSWVILENDGRLLQGSGTPLHQLCLTVAWLEWSYAASGT